MPSPEKAEIEATIKGMVPEKSEDVGSPIEGIVVNWDLEAKMPAKGNEGNGKKFRPCCRNRSRKCWAMSGCCGISLVAAVVCTCLFWPKDPTWELVKLDVLTDDAMQYFVFAFVGGMDNLNENTTFPELRFHAEANISNPNLLGGYAEEGGPGGVLFIQSESVGGGVGLLHLAFLNWAKISKGWCSQDSKTI